MTVCSSCGIEMHNNKKICQPCIQGRIDTTWKRQIRIYSIMAVFGAILLMYDISEVRALPHGADGIPVYLMGAAALGGLAVLGGLFGLALAVFFNVWHRKKSG